MGCLFSFLSLKQKSGEYQPLKEDEETRQLHEVSKLQALDDIDQQLLNDPSIKEILETNDNEGEHIDDEDIENLIDGIEKP